MRVLFASVSLIYILTTSWAFALEDTAGGRLLKLIEFNTSLEKLTVQIKDIGKENSKFTPEVKRDWDEVAEEIFQPEKFFNISAAYLNERLSADQFEEATIFFTGDLGLRMSKMEKTAQDPMNIGQAELLGPELLAELIKQNPERLEQIETMMDIWGGVEDSVAMAMNMSFAMGSAMISSSANPGAVTDAQLLNLISGQHDVIYATVKRNYLNNMAYTYQEATNEELDDYIVFLKSDLAQDIYSSMSLVMRNALTLSLTEFGKELMRRSRIRDL
jgi:hypothetical protein